MQKYDIELIKDYIEGNDIENYTMEELEDNPSFMLSVMKYTKDKKMYHFCSDRVKRDYDFTKSIIKKFQDDLDFCCMVAEECLKNQEQEQNVLELMALISDLIKNKEEYKDINIKYKLLLHAAYTRKRIEIESYKQNETVKEDPELLAIIGMGFEVMTSDFGSSDIITKYFASSFLSEIFLENGISNLETLIHNHSSSAKSLEKIGMTTFLINIIKEYDINLAQYISFHVELLDNVKKEVKFIETRWESYNRDNNHQKYDELYEFVDDYLDENIAEFPYNPVMIIHHFATRFGIADQVREYDQDWIPEEVFDMCMEEPVINPQEMNITQYRHYSYLKNMVKKFLGVKSVNNQKNAKEIRK